MIIPRSKRLQPLQSAMLGLLLGFMFTSCFRALIMNRGTPVCTLSDSFQVHRTKSSTHRVAETTTNDLKTEIPQPHQSLLFVGVMSAQKYLETRALAIYNTWGQNVPGKIMFFSSGLSQSATVPLVALKGVDDSYPPQKKSFLMLKYLHDHYLDRYEWFMRADDDVYVRTDLLETLLRSVNSSKPHFIGQAGVGNKDEFGQLNLESDENFCMGGPGIILSRETLRMLAPHIKYCLKHLFSTHEDVEVGRCVRKFVGIPCTWSYEMQSVFYHNFSGEVTTTGRLKTKEVHRAITLHPVKHPSNLYRIHSYFHSLKSQELRYRTLELHREIAGMALLRNDTGVAPQILQLGSEPGLGKFVPQSSNDVIPWNFFTKSIYSFGNLNPKHRIEGYLQTAFDDIVMQVMETINKFSKQRGRVIDFKEIYYGYYRVNPMYSADYVLDLLLTYKKYRGKKMTVPVRRHAYIQQTFSQIEIREIPQTGTETIHFILPLYGRTEIFYRFLNYFETVCLQKRDFVKMAVVLFQDKNQANESGEARKIFQTLRSKYPDYDLKMVEASGAFSRALALEIGAKLFPNDALLFFIDVDMIFNEKVLHRVRSNSVKGRSVYFPVVFSQYDPQFLDPDRVRRTLKDPFLVDGSVGYWRQFGFGIVGIYNSDLTAVGGMDTTIRGWGKEDVDLYTKAVLSNLTVVRSPDLDLVHIFHPIECEPSLEASQFEMCLGSLLSSMGPFEKIANLVLNNYDQYLPEQK